MKLNRINVIACLLIAIVVSILFSGCGGPYKPNTKNSNGDGDGDDGTGVLTIAGSLRSPSSLALYGDFVYWSDFYDSKIYRVGKSGGTVETVSSSGLNYPVIILIKDNFIYIGEADPTQPDSKVNAIKRIGASGSGSPVTLYDSQYAIGGLTADASNVYWTEHVIDNGSVKSASIGGGGTISTLWANLDRPGMIVLMNTYLFFVEEGNSADGVTSSGDGAIRRITPGGANALALASSLNFPASITSDSTLVYYSEGGTLSGSTDLGTIKKSSHNSAGSATLVSNANRITKVFYDSSNLNLYYNEGSGLSDGNGSIKKVAASGGDPTTIAGSQNSPGDLVTDETYVYWIEADWSGSNATIKRFGK